MHADTYTIYIPPLQSTADHQPVDPVSGKVRRTAEGLDD